MSKLVIQYDDDALEIINKVNKLLKQRGIWFVDDGKEHDGYMEFDLSDCGGARCAD